VKPLIIAGASGRAAAAAMLRRGWSPVVFDVFADADTQQLAPSKRCDSFGEMADKIRSDAALVGIPWMYTGGFENLPHLIDEISQDHPLMGNPSAVVAAVRDPFRLRDALAKIGGKMPRMQRKPPVPKGTWLCKSRFSGGGRSIHPFRTYVQDDDYLQEYLIGESVSAVFEGDCMIGTSKLIDGKPWLNVASFHYCGNLRDDRSPHREEFARLGRELAAAFGLVHFWGIDAIANDDGLHILEINPRYTASMELFDHGPCGKVIYYSPRSLDMPEYGPWDESLQNCRDLGVLHEFADITPPGECMPSCEPLISLFARGDTPEECLIQLQQAARRLDTFFGVTP
jgi:predicted ATP-grasp superfamily ATP-dependent carboligase